MWKYKKNPRLNPGYTIVEAMIVLAVTTALFVAIVATFGGQQGRTEFTSGAREVESKVQDILNDVSSGYYPSIGSYTCNAGGSGPTFSGSASSQGTNGGCIFIGRVIQFNVGGTSSREYRIFSVAGNRRASGKDVANFSEAKPRAITPTGLADDPPDATESAKYPSGITVGKVTYTNGALPVATDGLGVFSTFGSQSSSGGLNSGSITVNLVPLGNGTSPTQANMATLNINTLGSATPVYNPSGGLTVCLVSGSSNQHALLTIGGSQRQLTTTLEIKNGSTTCP